MVTKAGTDWNQHLKDIYEYYAVREGERRAKIFTEFYKNRYETKQRSYLYYRLAWLLYDDYNLVKRSGVRWYAFVGDGGTGKTTLAKNVLWFLDNQFTQQQIQMEAEKIVKELDKFPTVGAMRSILLDEPDETIHPNSKEGRIFRSILGKARQQALFMGYCATTLSDIPSYIYKKISGVFFTPMLGTALFFRNRPKKKDYVVQEIKEGYSKKGYGIFYELAHRKGCLKFKTRADTPLSEASERTYLNNKAEDYKRTREAFLKMKRPNKFTTELDDRSKIILNMQQKGMNHSEIAGLVGVSRSRITQILNELS